MQKNKITIAALAIISALGACQTGGNAGTHDIAGTYDRVDSSQFSILHQQIHITPVGGSASGQYHVKVFSITSFHSDRANDTTEKASNATFDAQSGVLTTDRSLTYHFDPATGKLTVKGGKDNVVFSKL